MGDLLLLTKFVYFEKHVKHKYLQMTAVNNDSRAVWKSFLKAQTPSKQSREERSGDVQDSTNHKRHEGRDKDLNNVIGRFPHISLLRSSSSVVHKASLTNAYHITRYHQGFGDQIGSCSM